MSSDSQTGLSDWADSIAAHSGMRGYILDTKKFGYVKAVVSGGRIWTARLVNEDGTYDTGAARDGEFIVANSVSSHAFERAVYKALKQIGI